jgi:TRAP transporter 4TM/12TM fusion protein
MSNTATAAPPDEFEGRVRRLGGTFWGRVISLGSVTLSLFHLYTAGFGTLPMIKQRSVHLGLVLFLVYLLFPASKKHSSRTKITVEAVILAILALVLNAYVYVRFDQIAMNSGIMRRMDLVAGALIIIVILEGCRRTSGNALPILMGFSLVYCYFGPYFPSFFRHNGLSLHRIIQFMVWSTEGVFGLVLGVSSTYLFVFILFGAVLDKTGLAGVINDLALSLAGQARGGPAKVAVIASAAMGTISGSAVANVATTGTLTIPMMKRTGYSPVFAASVEAVASTGGMIMPPIMGASAMIMAEFLGVPYVLIMKSALVPALLYYFAVWMVVDLEARRLNLPVMRKEDMQQFRKVLFTRGYLLIPIAVLIGLMVYGRTPLFSSFWSIVVAVAVSSIKKETRLNAERAVAALEDAGKLAIPVANTCAAVGIMVGMTGATGLGMVLGDGLIKIAGGNFYLTLFFAMLTSLILGMGLPSSACYIVVSTLAAPALMRFGIAGIPVHMFAFYYGILSVLTPPVCTASYTAAGIAGASPNTVGYSAFRMAIAGFLIPYMFITTPELLLMGDSLLLTVMKISTALIGTSCLAIAVVGFLKTKLHLYERIVAFLAGILLLDGGILTDIAGAAILVALLALNFMRDRKSSAAQS